MSDNLSNTNKIVEEILFECEFCGKKLTSKSNLKTHQKTAKYCLEKQNKEADILYKCKICGKSYTLKDAWKKHEENCSLTTTTKKEMNKELEELKLEHNKLLQNYERQITQVKEKYEELLKSKDDLISKYELKISDLELHIKDIAIKASTKCTTTHNNNNYNLQVFSYDDLDKCAENLTEEHVRNGKYDEVIVSAIMNKVICTDKARGTLRYNLGDGRKVMDPEGSVLITKAAEKLVDKNREIAIKICEEIQENLIKTEDSIQESILENKSSQIQKTHNDIVMTSKGYNTDFKKDIKKSICENPRIVKNGPRPPREQMEREMIESEIDQIVREIGD